MQADILRRNHVTVTGVVQPPMLFAHGFGCDQNMWRLVAPAFEATHRVIRFDYVGSGRSDKAAYEASRYRDLHGYAQDVLDVCEALDLQGVCFVGHSVSAMIGMLAAARQPERFAQLVMVAPSPCYINEPGYTGGFERDDLHELLALMDANGLSWASFLAPVVMGEGARPELTEELHGSFCATDPVIVRQFAEVTFLSDHRADLARCRTPSLIIQCSDDALAPVSVGHYLRANLAGSTLVQIAANGHCPHVSHPELTVATMRGYLTGR